MTGPIPTRRAPRVQHVLAGAFGLALAACGGGEGGPPTPPTSLMSPPPTPTPAPTPTPTPSTDILGTDSDDVLNGTSGDDAIFGRGGNDTISGLGGNDRLEGGPGSDTVRGGDGADRITGIQVGPSELDAFFGGAGADVFHFDAHVSSLITNFTPAITAHLNDFQTGMDRLDLRLTGTSSNDTSLYWLDNQPFTGQNRLEVRLENGILQLDDNGDRIPELTLQITGTIAPSDLSFVFDPFGF